MRRCTGGHVHHLFQRPQRTDRRDVRGGLRRQRRTFCQRRPQPGHRRAAQRKLGHRARPDRACRPTSRGRWSARCPRTAPAADRSPARSSAHSGGQDPSGPAKRRDHLRHRAQPGGHRRCPTSAPKRPPPERQAPHQRAQPDAAAHRMRHQEAGLAADRPGPPRPAWRQGLPGTRRNPRHDPTSGPAAPGRPDPARASRW